MRIGVVALLLAAVAIAPMAAPADDCRSITVNEPEVAPHPRIRALLIEGLPVHVLMPARYDESGETRYPVLYLLHGFTMNHNSWLYFSDLIDFTAREDAGDVIVVLPAMNGFAADLDHRNGTGIFETFFVERLIPAIDAAFPTLSDRSHRAVAGLSAVSALIFAARHPDLFVAAGGLSTGATFTPSAEAFPFERFSWWCYGGAVGDEGVLGDPVGDTIWYADVSPVDLARNFRGMSIYFSIGTGTPCDEEDVRELLFPVIPAEYAVAHWGEAFLRTTQQSFHEALTAEGIPHRWDARDCGLHTWRWFEDGLHEFWPQMLDAFGSPPPAAFDFRTVDAPENRRAGNGAPLASNHRVWGWTFRADPARAPESSISGAGRRRGSRSPGRA
ncbi:MAG: alpha/beta hydrolase [Candidatus Binatia bacterium]